jgi:acyl-CoA hydrolase
MSKIIKKKDYNYKNSILVKPEDLNPAGSLFGGRLLEWLDEKGAIFCYCQIDFQGLIVTKLISEINFVSSAKNGDIIEFGFKTVSLGKSSIAISCIVKNKHTKTEILRIEKMVFVYVDPETKKAIPHGFILED